MEPEVIGTTNDTEAVKRTRQKREPVGTATPLTAAMPGAKPRKRVGEAARQILPDTSKLDPAFRYFFATDKLNSVPDLLDRGYEICNADGSLVDVEAGKATSLGSQVLTMANASLGEKGVLMRIRKELFAEDQADKQRVVDKTETMMNLVSKDLKGQYAPKDENGQQVGIRIGR